MCLPCLCTSVYYVPSLYTFPTCKLPGLEPILLGIAGFSDGLYREVVPTSLPRRFKQTGRACYKNRFVFVAPQAEQLPDD
jgi:hypothetical protein